MQIFASHGISLPNEPNDLFFFEWYKLALVTKPKYSDGLQPEMPKIGDPLSTFRCLVCTEGKASKRTFKLLGVLDHLRAK